MTDLDYLEPLWHFHRANDKDLAVTFLDPAALPERDRQLLVHDRDMTSRLAQFHGTAITLEVHASEQSGDYLLRASVLRRQDTGAPVELGAIRIDLTGFHGEPLRLILEAHVPLGGVLINHAIPFTSHPRGFFQIRVDSYLEQLLGAEPGGQLYGRCNELRHADGRLMAEVVEILPG